MDVSILVNMMDDGFFTLQRHENCQIIITMVTLCSMLNTDLAHRAIDLIHFFHGGLAIEATTLRSESQVGGAGGFDEASEVFVCETRENK